MSGSAKPRIRLSRGLWICFQPGRLCVGYGYTPAGAYEEWVRVLGGAR